MGFRLELAHGTGKPRFWEVACDHCEVMGHFPIAAFTHFPAAFEEAVRLGWDVNADARGTARYSCPDCAGPNRGGDDGETVLSS